MRRTVLIVDDSWVNRSILKKILADHYDTEEAADGTAALEIVRAQGEQLSAILLDLVMPGMGGIAFLDVLAREFPGHGIPVIVMTGEESEDIEIQALRHGSTDFLSKPYRPQIILARLQNLIALRETAALVHRVSRDRLTGLYNREAFYERLGQLLQEEPDTPVDVVDVDIGNFKLVNDLYGEEAGDEMIRAVAAGIQHSFGDNGALLARKTGDQFLLAFPGGGPDGQSLWQASQTWELPLDMSLPFRFGICRAKGPGDPVSVLCDNAKLAADSVRGRYDIHAAVYTPSMRKQLLADHVLADDLEAGLQTGQFEAWYQPKCDPATGKAVGAEALVRWRHPTRGTLLPDTFVPLFEKNRLITKLDAFMWRQVCQNLRDWVESGHTPVPVSVNLSRVDVYQRDLVSCLSSLVEGMDTALLPLEITESAHADDPQQLLDTIRALREKGFQIVMDDFGAGQSSLNVLTELPLDGLKLDMKFLRDFPRNSKFLRHLLQMISDLGLPVTAEGVETRAQAEFLAEVGCHAAQGNFFAPALPRLEFEAFLEKNT